MTEAHVDITIFDTTLRDGAQALPKENQFPEGSKPEIADKLASLGIGVIEAGFPATPGDSEEVSSVSKQVGNEIYSTHLWTPDGHQDTAWDSPIIAGLSRTTPADIEATWDAVQYASRPRIHTFVSTDNEHMAEKFPDMSPDEVLRMGRAAVKQARELVDQSSDGTVEFSAEAASTTDPVYLERVIKAAVDEGADVINLPDTVGQRDPSWMEDFYYKAIAWIQPLNPDVTISAHCHNDLGMAVANSYSLVKAAAKYSKQYERIIKVQAETTICGLGERAGNADVFPFIGGVFKFTGDLGVPVGWRFNPEYSVLTAEAVMKYAGQEVSRQSPVVGRDTNVHRSGIHSAGIIAGGENGHRLYTPYDPTFWGHAQNAIHEEGKYQGRKGTHAAKTNSNAITN